MTAAWIIEHARRQQRFFRWAERAQRWLPRSVWPRAAEAVGRHFSAELPEALKIWQGLQQFTGCSDGDAHRLLAQWYANQGANGIELHDYPRLDAAWAREQVRCDDAAVLAQLVARGGLVLTYHSHHHNRLGAFLGLSGTKVWGIAATEAQSPWKPWTGRWVRLINGGSERCFGGGRYLYTDQMRELLVASRAAFERGETVVTLADNPSDSPSAAAVDMAGRTLPVATGMIELAIGADAPITFALFYSDLVGRHRCRLALAPSTQDATLVAQAYLQQLQRWLGDAPHAWQGWAWWADLAARAPANPVWQAQAASAAQRYAASLPPPGWKGRLFGALGALESRLMPPRP